MSNKLVYDTLAYAKLLKEGGVEHAEIHSEALASTVGEQFYTKNEVEKMFDAALKHFDERSFQMRDEFKESLEKFDERTNQMREEIRQETKVIEQRSYEIEIRFERAMRNHLVAMIAILGSLIVVTNGLVSFFAHSSSWGSKQAASPTAIHAPVQTTSAVAPKSSP